MITRCVNCDREIGFYSGDDDPVCSIECLVEHEERIDRIQSYVGGRRDLILSGGLALENADAFLRTLGEIRALPTAA